MKKSTLNTKGFGVLGVLAVIVVLAVAGGAGVYVYHHNHKTKAVASTSSTNKSNTSQTSKTKTTIAPPEANPYAGWKTYTDSTYHYSFKYPAGWTLTTSNTAASVGEPGQVTLTNSSKTVSVAYVNDNTRDSSPIAFTPSVISKLSSANEGLTAVGGYSPAGGLVGNYQPSYRIVDNSFLTTYPLTVGESSQFPSNARFTDKDTGNSSYTGSFVSLPTTAINTVSDAQAWLVSADTKTSLLILESLTYNN